MDVDAPPSLQDNTTHGSWQGNSPIPYLCGGLAATLGLIAIALLILACAYGKYSSDENSDTELENLPKRALPPAEFEPMIVVIMAGNDKPTCLADQSPFLQFKTHDKKCENQK
ncbi:hypothetical protein IFM89_010401 [Coptis chinensis]|uniref:Uncharacterized protein n=1 Tax=Coptis chinensis TaxID=261450 RepID=A0A835LHI2_9MAGN|nr:hypothetical protein IFM89_010401 [Coptis chinensis]